jgi:hypothetical protein
MHASRTLSQAEIAARKTEEWSNFVTIDAYSAKPAVIPEATSSSSSSSSSSSGPSAAEIIAEQDEEFERALLIDQGILNPFDEEEVDTAIGPSSIPAQPSSQQDIDESRRLRAAAVDKRLAKSSK